MSSCHTIGETADSQSSSHLNQLSPINAQPLRCLTGLRGIAAWWVVLFHFREYFPDGSPSWFSALCGHGYLAVDLFFVLSGFIIAHNYLNRLSHFRLAAYLHFLGVRLARVYPLHIFMLLLFLMNPIAILIASSRGHDYSRYEPWYYLMSVFLIQNWGFSDELAWNVPAWSISAEWMAYLLFPIFAWLARRCARNILTIIIGVLLPLILLGIGLALMGEDLGGSIPQNGLLRCVTEFASGVFVHRLWTLTEKYRMIVFVGSVVLASMVFAYLYLGVSDSWALPFTWAFAVLLLATEPRMARWILANRVMETIGLWSYSTYLAHYFVRDWVKFLLIRDGAQSCIPIIFYIGGTVFASVLLYRLIEIPGRNRFRYIVDRWGGFTPGRRHL